VSKRIPAYVGVQFGGVGKFRAYHRQHLDSALQELGHVMRGSAWTPGYAELLEARRLLELAREKARVKNWERAK
jgi:hypothetical protein